MSKPLVTVITASTGRDDLARCIESVAAQTYGNVQHLIFADGVDAADRINGEIDTALTVLTDIIELPYPTGRDRWNGHRMYAAGTYLAEGDAVMFLDDDNTIDPDHIESCMAVLNTGKAWTYSLRKIVDTDGNFLCNDDCESLGKWASILHPEDLFIDVNCYFLRRNVAVAVTPVWFRKFREPNQMEVDRALSHVLRNQVSSDFDCTYKYSVNYAVGSTGISVTPEFFEKGNAEMLRRYNGVLPWVKK